MKKFIKGCLIAALVFVILGICILAGAVAAGGMEQVAELVRDGSLSIHYSPNDWDDDFWEETAEDDIWEEAVEGMEEPEVDSTELLQQLGQEEKLSRTVLAQEPERIRKLELSLLGGAVCIKPSQDNTISIAYDDQYALRCKKDGETLRIEEATERHHIGSYNKRVIYLYIPQNQYFEQVECKLGGGVMEIQKLTAQSAEFKLGAGMLTVKNLGCVKAEAKIGAGSMYLENAEVEEGEFKIGAGELEYQGSIGKKLETVCDLGSAVFELDGQETDFDYEIGVAAGEISVGSHSYSGLNEKTKVDNKAGRRMELECSMGSIEVSFE
ncbi:MAG: DUF4097 family beta strand repeat protein [Lachnospiraceae bacterium]|nr:DUF4097 family beta strand repeat protein [Lachnospiraceae bacterium]